MKFYVFSKSIYGGPEYNDGLYCVCYGKKSFNIEQTKIKQNATEILMETKDLIFVEDKFGRELEYNELPD